MAILATIQQDFSSTKTVELIIYISSRLKEKLNYGITLLGKSLYLIDSMSYLKTGKPITQLKYIKQDYGPTPKSARFLLLRDQLETNGDLKKVETKFYGRTQYKFIPTREPDINVFDKNELVLINDVIESVSNQNASELSDYTHQFLSWIFANHKEELPFYTFLLSQTELNTKDLDWAKNAIENYQVSL